MLFIIVGVTIVSRSYMVIILFCRLAGGILFLAVIGYLACGTNIIANTRRVYDCSVPIHGIPSGNRVTHASRRRQTRFGKIGIPGSLQNSHRPITTGSRAVCQESANIEIRLKIAIVHKTHIKRTENVFAGPRFAHSSRIT